MISSDMDEYLVHHTYYRRITPDEVQQLLNAGQSLLILDKNGQPRHVENPMDLGGKTPAELYEQWRVAALSGRVFVVWANRWMRSAELPPVLPVATAEPVHA